MNITLTNGIYINKYGNLKNNKKSNTNLYINNKNLITADTFEKKENIKNSGNISFGGITRALTQIPVKSTEEAIKQWEKLKYAPYYEALDDHKFPENKIIRAQNFSFLDNLTPEVKKGFTEYFEKFTGFPDLDAVSAKIENEFINQVNQAAQRVASGVKIIAAGYDPTCSVGLRRAFPGSGLNKSFVVLRNASSLSDTEAVNHFKGNLWFNIDQRILSLNKADNFPEVYTMEQVHRNLDLMDLAARKLWFADGVKTYMKDMQEYETDPIKGGYFNINLTRVLPLNSVTKEFAKNFAYFIESVRDGKNLILNKSYYNTLYYAIRLSEFGKYTNVSRINAHNKLISSGHEPVKPKLRLRSALAQEYKEMNTEEKFELVKDIIKAVSKDNDNPKFAKYFENDAAENAQYEELNKTLVGNYFG